MSNKLHELLAIEQDRKHKVVKSIGETVNTFTKKTAYFDGMVKRYLPMEEDSEQIPDEVKEMVTTVKGKLEEVLADIVQSMDANISKEETNCSGVAKAELVVNGESLGIFSATSLLSLESQITKIREMYAELPILDPVFKWNFDTQQGVYKTEPEVKFRSVKRPKVVVKYEATKEHPAQTELLQLDFQIGKYETVYTSGRIPFTQKSELLRRIDNLLEAIKVARSKANNVDVNNVKIGKKIFDFIHKGIL